MFRRSIAAVENRLRGFGGDVNRGLQRRTAKRAAGRGTGLVLLYHRVAETSEDPWDDAVTPARFEEHLECLRSEMRPMPLAELIAAADRGSIPERSVAISFDDGYADNLTNALPILERQQVPATLFVAAGFLDDARPFWWDELIDLLLGPGERPARLEAEIGTRSIDVATGTREERLHALYVDVHPALSALPPDAIDIGLDPIRTWAGPEARESTVNGTGSSAARPMSWAELERFSASPLTEVGAHTMLHPRMPKLPAAAQASEAKASRQRLTEVCGGPPRFFAYPFGAADRLSERAARAAGFERAFGTQDYLPVTVASRPFRVPRMAIVEEGAPEFLSRLRRGLAVAG